MSFWKQFPRAWTWRLWSRPSAAFHGVLAVHDLHVWTIGSGMVCGSCHIMVDEPERAQWRERLTSRNRRT